MHLSIDFRDLTAQERTVLRAMLDALDAQGVGVPLPVLYSADAPALQTAPAVPTPGPAMSAPSAPAPKPDDEAADAAPGPASKEGLDVEGLPWDERIHSGPGSKTKAGKWVYRRGINDPELVKRVEAELRAAASAVPLPPVSAPATPTIAPSAAPGASTAVATSEPSAAAVSEVPLPPSTGPAPAIPTAPTSAAPASPAVSVVSFNEIMPKLTAAMAAGTIPKDALQNTLTMMGMGTPIDVIKARGQGGDWADVWDTLKNVHAGVLS